MASLQGQSDSSNTNKLFERHPVKMLNLGLILYLGLGAFLFDALGEFQEPLKPSDSSQSGATDLRELRLKSVRRMWNITNQLNILYESNWTQLVLDELVEFERQFSESLADLERVAGGDVGEEQENSSSKKDEQQQSTKSKSDKSRTRSIKKSLIHSLATITTIGSPVASPKSELGKLATVLYGAMGIPLLFCTVAQTGHQLARSAANTLLLTRHYCVSLPLHYLCCTCNFRQCLRWLSWCCCCCCCSYFCCQSHDKSSSSKRRDKSRAPTLRLIKSSDRTLGRRSRAAAGAKLRNQSRVANVMGAKANLVNGGGQQHFKQQGDTFGSQQKSVRFFNQQQRRRRPSNTTNSDNNQLEFVSSESSLDQPEVLEESPLRAPGLFVTSLTLLTLYLSLGSFIYSRTQNTSLVEAVVVCYDLLSVSRWPSSAVTGQPSSSNKVATLYQSLKATNKTGNQLKFHQIVQEASGGDLFEFDSLAWQTLYLICGLNLVSMCSQFANLWLSDNLEDQLDGALELACNGFDSYDGANCCAQIDSHQMAPGAKEGAEPQFMMQALMDAGQLVAPTNSIPQQQQQIDLAQLFVVTGQEPPPALGIQYAGQQHHLTAASDVSYNSDRSTERGSLCQLHQASSQLGPSAASAIYNSNQPPSYGIHHQGTLRSRKEQLYPQQQEAEEEEEDYEMDRMLKTCISNGNQHPSSSSSLQLSHSNGYLSANAVDGFNLQQQHQHRSLLESSSSTGRQLRLMNEPNGCDLQDSTTNSNTISSVSSRTVKLPHSHIHIHNGIGFILDGAQTDSNHQN